MPFAWIALGSVARREAVPSSDIDSALVWYTDDEDPELKQTLMGLAGRVMDGLADCGFKTDPKGAIASKPLFARSHAAWVAAVNSWIDNPTQEKALILVSLVVDGRPVWGIREGPPVPDAFRDARRKPALLRLLAQFALSHRPPTGFMRGLVVEDSGEHRGRLDLKRGGIVPIADLARWAGLEAAVTHASTPARLRAAADAGTLEPADARLLEEAHDLIAGLRLAHQVEQLKAGVEPDDFLDPGALSTLTRRSLKEAFRVVAGVQRRDRRRPAPRGAVRRSRKTPWREAAFCVVDLETTGLDPRTDAILAWAAVPVDGGRVVLSGAREGLVRPPGSVPAESIRIHGLREIDLGRRAAAGGGRRGAARCDGRARARRPRRMGRAGVPAPRAAARASAGRSSTRGRSGASGSCSATATPSRGSRSARWPTRSACPPTARTPPPATR